MEKETETVNGVETVEKTIQEEMGEKASQPHLRHPWKRGEQRVKRVHQAEARKNWETYKITGTLQQSKFFLNTGHLHTVCPPSRTGYLSSLSTLSSHFKFTIHNLTPPVHTALGTTKILQ